MFLRSILVALSLTILSAFQPAKALLINADLSNVSGNIWQYNYSVTNDGLAADIEFFTIIFPDAEYSDLSIVSGPADWLLEIFSQPGDFIPGEDGYVDATALVAGIAPGATLGGFVVQFVSDSIDMPAGGQSADVYDVNFNLVDSGSTPVVSSVANPSVSILFTLALGFIIASSFNKQKKQEIR